MAERNEFDYIKSQLYIYYSYLNKHEKYLNKAKDVLNIMTSIKSPTFSDEPKITGSTNRDRRIIGLIDDKDRYLAKAEQFKIKATEIELRLHFDELSDTQMKMIEMVHNRKMSYSNIGDTLGYSKIQVYRIIKGAYTTLKRYEE